MNLDIGYFICFCILLFYVCLMHLGIDKNNDEFISEKKIIMYLFTTIFIIVTILECIDNQMIFIMANTYLLICTLYGSISIICYLNNKIK